MRFIIIALLTLSLSISFAQESIQFNNNYSITQYHAAKSLIGNDSVYYLIGAELREDDLGYITAWKFDTLGNFISKKSYGDGQYFYTLEIENTCIRSDNGFIACGTKGNFVGALEIGIMLYKFDAAFDALWAKNFLQDTVPTVSYAVTNCSDGGYAIVGTTERDAATGEALPRVKALLLRTDSLGNYLWHKTYGTDNYFDKFYKVVQTPDGGFLCGGSTKSYSGSHNIDWYLVKTDSLGQEEWSRTYGHPYYDDSRICGITKTQDSSYIISGAKAISSDYKKTYVLKLDQNFETDIEKTFNCIGVDQSIFKTIELSNGDFVAVGTERPETYSAGLANLRKLDADLNEIWYRKYTVGDTISTPNYILSVDTCPDGGYILGGWAVHSGQKLALIKTDSFGCDGTDWWPCNTDVMVKPYVHSDGFKLYPNPTNHFVVIESSTSTSSASERLKVESLAIYDISGKIIKSIAINESSEDFRLDVSSLESGIYLVKLGQRVEKLVVE